MSFWDVQAVGYDSFKFIAAIILFFIALYGIGYKLVYQKAMHGEKKLPLKKLILCCLLAISVVIILYATIFRADSYDEAPSFIPFSSYKAAWYSGDINEWRNFVLNMLMFVPLGFILPLLSKKLRKPWRVYLSGFAFSLMIEASQLILKKGLFEADDIINNSLGTIIGYGLFVIAYSIYSKKFSKAVILCQIPLLCVIVAGATLGCVYNLQEFGNTIYQASSKHEMPEITTDKGIQLSDEDGVANVYKKSVLTKDVGLQYAEALFDASGEEIAEIVNHGLGISTDYYSNDHSTNVTVDYQNGKIFYTNNAVEDFDNAQTRTYLYDADEAAVRQAVASLGIEIPENASFSSQNGNYIFKVNDDGSGDVYYTGSLSCSLNDKGEVAMLTSELHTGDIYKSVDIISSQAAFDMVSQGQFYSKENNFSKDSPLELTELNLTYVCDSKGFYQPAYEFVLKTESDKTETIYIMAMK